jgi:ABC-2 type transport system ATP-binding protein
MTHLVEFREVRKTFIQPRKVKGTRALDGLTLEVEPGSIYGLLGRNGAGKTTALRMIPGIITPDRGSVRVMEERPEEMDDITKSKISYAGAGQVYMPEMTVREMGDFVKDSTPAWDDRLFTEIIEEGYIPPRKLVRSLSRGMRQRLRLALAYARRPKVLVLDEPAEGLDTVVRFSLFARALDAVADGDACAIVSSHVLGDVERVVDRIGFIADGKILAEGALDDIKERARRVRFAWSDGVDPTRDIEEEAQALEAASIRVTARQASFVTLKFNDDWFGAMKQKFHTCMVETDPLSLEEVFIELLGEGS